MPRAASIPVGLLTFLGLALTVYLFNSAESRQDRNILLGLLLLEGAFITWLIWSFSRPVEDRDADPIPLPRNRSPEVLPPKSPTPPRPRPAYQHQPLKPARPPFRASNPLPPPLVLPRRQAVLPPVPDLTAPQNGKPAPRMPENPPRPNTAKPKRVTFNLDDLLPPAPTPPGPAPTATAVPAPAPKDIEQGRPKRPAKFSRFNEDSADIPAKIDMTQLKLCCDILALGYACASCDGPVSTDEDQHLQGWAWCVIENSADKDASTFHQALFDTATLCKNRGKQKLDAVEALANSIRGTGEKKLIQSAAELCREIIIQDDRLEPGEYAILSTALRGLGVKKVKAEDVAGELLAKDDEFAAILREANITDLTKPAERDAILSKEWSKYNAYTNLRDQPPAKLEKFRRKMALISKLREIYREMNN